MKSVSISRRAFKAHSTRQKAAWTKPARSSHTMDRQELAISRHAIVRGKKPYITYRVYPSDDDPLREEIPVRMLEVF